MKTANVQHVPQQWAQILGWIADGEEVQVIQQDKIVATLIPPAALPAQPDFLARAKNIWGERPAGQPLSEIVHTSRGNKP